MQSKSLECWEPLEATAESFNTLLRALGVSAWKFVQVLDLDDEDNNPAVAKSVAFVLLYPTIPEVEKYLRRPAAATTSTAPPSLFFVRQLVGGSCGTIAVLHALMNGVNKETIPKDSPLRGLMGNEDYSTEKAAVLNRSQRVVQNASIQDAHRAAAGGSDDTTTNKSLAGERQGRHYLTFIKKDGAVLWELDGRRDLPVCRKSNSTFLSEIKGILTSTDDPKVHFGSSVLALVPAE